VREAQLFCTAARTGGAQFLDEVETLRDDPERFDALVTELRARYAAGA
jgi:hypothetical protein